MNPGDLSAGDMESNIIQAATSVFVKKGRTGASMQDIADEAGINRTLLNYYFRSKEKLFNIVFDEVLNTLIKNAMQILISEKDVLVKIEQFIELYIRTLIDNPQIPVFILNELSTNPERLIRIVKSQIIQPLPIIKDLEKAMEAGRIIKTDPHQLIVNLISLIVFPFAAQPMLSGIFFSDREVDFGDFMEQRIAFLKRYFIKSIII